MTAFRNFVSVALALGRAALVGIVGALLLSFAGCSGTDVGSFIGGGDDGGDSSTLYGNYLAARFAGAERDMSSAAQYYERALEQDPENNIILERAFFLQLADGNVDKAVELARRMVGNDERNRLARLTMGLAAFKKEDFTTARSELDLSRSGPINMLVRNLVTAWSYAAEGNGEQAVATLDEAAKAANLPTVYMLNRAYIYDFLARNDEATADYLETMRLTEGQSVDVVLAYGSLLERMGRTGDAKRLYDEYVTATGEDRWVGPEIARLNAGKAPQPYVKTPNQGVAMAIFDPAAYLVRERAVDLPIIYLQLALYMDPDYTDARLLLAEIFEANGSLEQAVRIYQDVPRDAILYDSIQIQVAVDLDRLDRTDEAVSLLKSISRKADVRYDAMITLGDILRIRERFDEAIDVYNEAIAMVGQSSEKNWSIYYSRGVALEQSGRWQEAEQDFLKALELSPNQPSVLNYLGYSWIDQDINVDKAMSYIEKAVELSPDDGFIIDSLGWGYYKIGKYEQAVVALERAIELQPDDPTINEHLGDAYWRVGRQIEARFQWRLALAMSPEEKVIPELQRKLIEGLETKPAREAESRPLSIQQ